MKGHGSGLGVSQPPSPMGRQKHPSEESVVNVGSGPIRTGGMLPYEWLSGHINSKEIYTLYHVLRQLCARPPDALRHAQVLINVDNQSRVGAFKRGRAKNSETHALLVQLFDLPVAFGFLLTVKWIRTASNEIADGFSRRS